MGSGGLAGQEVEAVEGWKGPDACGEAAEEFDGAEAVGVEGVVDVVGQIGADRVGGEVEAGRPFGDELVDVGKPGVAASG